MTPELSDAEWLGEMARGLDEAVRRCGLDEDMQMSQELAGIVAARLEEIAAKILRLGEAWPTS